MVVEIQYFEGCPHAASTVALVRSCAARVAAEISIVESEGDYASPTVLVNGDDIMGDPGGSGRACRRDLPSEEQITRALEAAAGAV